MHQTTRRQLLLNLTAIPVVTGLSAVLHPETQTTPLHPLHDFIHKLMADLEKMPPPESYSMESLEKFINAECDRAGLISCHRINFPNFPVGHYPPYRYRISRAVDSQFCPMLGLFLYPYPSLKDGLRLRVAFNTATDDAPVSEAFHLNRMMHLKDAIMSMTTPIFFAHYDDRARQAIWTDNISKILKLLRSTGGLADYMIVCNDLNNPPEVVAARGFCGDVFLKFPDQIPFIKLRTELTRRGPKTIISPGVDVREVDVCERKG
jgi:hypothetical protein